MKTLTLALVTLLSSAAARADGFVCESLAGDLNAKVYNKTSDGTRTAAIMILSNPHVSAGRKTIATFRNTSSTLSSSGAAYYAEVDAENAETARGGELIAGTKLGFVSAVNLYVNFSYATPVADGEEVYGKMIVIKNNGERIPVDMVCARYLKGE